MPVSEVVLARIVRPIREPEADDARSELLRDVDAFAAMAQSARADGHVGVAQAAEAVLVVAEEIRVDRPYANTLLLSEASQLPVVVNGVPGDMERDGRAAAGEPVHERRVGDPLADRAGGAGPRVDVKAGAGVPVAPGRGLELERGEPGKRGGVGHAASVTHRPPHLQIDFRSTPFRKPFEGIDLWFGPG